MFLNDAFSLFLIRPIRYRYPQTREEMVPYSVRFILEEMHHGEICLGPPCLKWAHLYSGQTTVSFLELAQEGGGLLGGSEWVFASEFVSKHPCK